MAAETGFQINGTVYEIPSIDTFDMDEAQVLYDYSGLTLESFVRAENETPEETEARVARFDNPGFQRALMHIAYQREHLNLKPAKVKALVGAAKWIDAISTLSEKTEDGDDLPPASTTELEPSSPSGSVGSNETSGNDSPSGSEPRASGLARIGTSRSDTSSPASPRTTSVA